MASAGEDAETSSRSPLRMFHRRAAAAATASKETNTNDASAGGDCDDGYSIMKDGIYIPLGKLDSRRTSAGGGTGEGAPSPDFVDVEKGGAESGGGFFRRRSSRAAPVSATPADVPPGEEPPPPPHEGMRILREQFAAFVSMAMPFYRESRPGRALFAVMVVLALLNSAVRVAFSYLVRDFWSALSDKDVELFWSIMAKFVGACVALAPISVLYRYQRQKLAIKWREWMTERTMRLYYSNRVYYCLERGREIDNPDQRIAEDVRSFTEFSLSLFLNIVTSTIDMVCFSVILYSIRPQLFVAIVLFASFGTVFTVLIGRVLIRLNFEKLQREANFRYSLVRIRENAESIAFYAGEDREAREVDRRFSRVIGNMEQVNVAQRNLDFFTTFYNYLVWILPVAVVAPSYFAGAVQMGVVQQSSSAFGHVLDDLSIIVNQFESLSQFSAGIDRLHQFVCAIRRHDPDRDEEASPLMDLPPRHEWSRSASPDDAGGFGRKEEKIQVRPVPACLPGRDVAAASGVDRRNGAALTLTDLTLLTPDWKRSLVRDLDLRLRWGQNLLIVGPSGAGKSSLLRAVAGLWTAGSGTIERPPDDDVYFLPQRPYCALGSLRDQLLYPGGGAGDGDDAAGNSTSGGGLRLYGGGRRPRALRRRWSDRELLDVLDAVDLSDLARRAGDGDAHRGLDAVLDWSNTLSLGEQQRLAFGRILVNRPRLVIMDESTSALDVRSENRMFALLKGIAAAAAEEEKELVTYVSVGHRPTLAVHHDVRLRLGGVDDHSFEPIPPAGGSKDGLDENSFLG